MIFAATPRPRVAGVFAIFWTKDIPPEVGESVRSSGLPMGEGEFWLLLSVREGGGAMAAPAALLDLLDEAGARAKPIG